MKTHSSKANVQHFGCGALQNLAMNENNRETITEAGGITTILSAMKTHLYNADVQDFGCGALNNLAENNDNNQVTIAEAGGITTIISAMKTHSSKDNSIGANLINEIQRLVDAKKAHEQSAITSQPNSTTKTTIKVTATATASNTNTMGLSYPTTPTPSGSSSTDPISIGRSKMKAVMDNVNSIPIELPVEFINSCTNNFDEALKLGEGAFGAVYKGKFDNRYFAVKCLLFNVAVEKDTLQEISKSFKIELEVSSCVVSNSASCLDKTLCFSFFSFTVSGIKEVPTPPYCIFVWLLFVL
jgi:hypothetical protein